MKASMCFKGFRGKGAWRTCWMRDESKTLWLIVGGADGGIKMYDCRQLDRPATESSASLVVVAKEEENDKKKKKKKTGRQTHPSYRKIDKLEERYT